MRNIIVKDIMTPNIVFIPETETLLKAAQRMKQADCGFLPVGTANALSGVLTDRDIIIRAVALKKDLSHEKVADFMTPKVYGCNEHDFVEDAAEKMKEHAITRLVVRNEHGAAVGVLSLNGIIRSDANVQDIAQAFKHAYYPDYI